MEPADVEAGCWRPTRRSPTKVPAGGNSVTAKLSPPKKKPALKVTIQKGTSELSNKCSVVCTVTYTTVHTSKYYTISLLYTLKGRYLLI